MKTCRIPLLLRIRALAVALGFAATALLHPAAALAQNSATGSIAGAVSVPTRHIHQTIETCNKQDLADCVKLLTACICDLDRHDWDF